ncbi:tetratricopeptide repeat-containing sensor histidine kinase [Winogradskyella sp.]|uniref:tetratricopeptide repeat-containing sensor histidine kinase n=1 Tax=Winogradskyella sp. TaxID=1883156 RepID=UPI003BAB13EC
MKRVIVFLGLISVLYGYTQDDLKPKVDALLNQIGQTEQLQELILLDSLTRLVMDKPEFQYDSIAQVTITKAMDQDSIRMAVQHFADLIFYHGNVSQFPEKGIVVYDKFKHLIDNSIDNELLCLLNRYTGDLQFYSGKLQESISFYEKAEQFALAANDSIEYAIARSSKARAILDKGNYVESSKLLAQTAKLFTRYKDTFYLTGARCSLSILYSKMGFIEAAKKERDEVIKLASLQKDYLGLPSYFHNASIDAYKTGDQVARIANLKNAYRDGLKSDEGFPLKPIIVFELLRAYAETDSLTKAKVYYDKAHTLYTQSDAIPYEDFYRVALAAYYEAKGQPEKALVEAQKALELLQDINDVEGIFEAYERLGKIYKRLGDLENAYVYNTKFIALKDSVNNIQKANALSYYQTLYETEKRDAKIAAQDNEITVLDQKNKVKQQWMLFGGIGLLVLFLVLYLMRSKRFAVTKQKMQEAFAHNLILEQEKERSRLARELHDSVGQKLMLLSKTTKKGDNYSAESLAKDTLEEVRSISRGLHPSNLERLGLTQSINALVYNINASTDLFFTEDIDNIDNILSKSSELHVYRIIQEALSNIVKHAEAKAVKMRVKKVDDKINVLVSDNGRGFDFEAKYKTMSLGLKTLFERAKMIGAQLNLDSGSSKGTQISLDIPLNAL